MEEYVLRFFIGGFAVSGFAAVAMSSDLAASPAFLQRLRQSPWAHLRSLFQPKAGSMPRRRAVR
jgi:hypothetical protein